LEIIFLGHGQGVHNTDIPDRLNLENPRLTKKGREQVTNLESVFSFNEDDVFIASPTLKLVGIRWNYESLECFIQNGGLR